MSMLSNRVYCSSSCGRIDLTLTVEDIIRVTSSGEQSENVLDVIQNDITLQDELKKYSTELKLEVIDEYGCDDIEHDNLANIDLYLVWLLAGSNEQTEFVIYNEEKEKYYNVYNKTFSTDECIFALFEIEDDWIIPNGYKLMTYNESLL